MSAFQTVQAAITKVQTNVGDARDAALDTILDNLSQLPRDAAIAAARFVYQSTDNDTRQEERAMAFLHGKTTEFLIGSEKLNANLLTLGLATG